MRAAAVVRAVAAWLLSEWSAARSQGGARLAACLVLLPGRDAGVVCMRSRESVREPTEVMNDIVKNLSLSEVPQSSRPSRHGARNRVKNLREIPRAERAAAGARRGRAARPEKTAESEIGLLSRAVWQSTSQTVGIRRRHDGHPRAACLGSTLSPVEKRKERHIPDASLPTLDDCARLGPPWQEHNTTEESCQWTGPQAHHRLR